MQFNHGSDSSFSTVLTNSSASWKRLYTLANRTKATSSSFRNPSITRSPITWLGHDPLDEVLDVALADGTLLAGALDAGQEFLLRERLSLPAALDHHQVLVLDLLVGGEPVPAAQTLAPTPDERAFAGGA
jgi:hypothetical protein